MLRCHALRFFCDVEGHLDILTSAQGIAPGILYRGLQGAAAVPGGSCYLLREQRVDNERTRPTRTGGTPGLVRRHDAMPA